jgi:hypothetical protein
MDEQEVDLKVTQLGLMLHLQQVLLLVETFPPQQDLQMGASF